MSITSHSKMNPYPIDKSEVLCGN